MKKLIPILICVLIVLCAGDAAFGCTCEVSFRKNFRRASSVFRGKVVEVNRGAGGGDGFKDIVRLDVERTWKGPKRKTVAINAGQPNFATGMCGSFGFEKDKGYVVFAFTDKLLVHTECSATFAIEQGSKWQIKQLDKLDNFWYRSWAALYPF